MSRRNDQRWDTSKSAWGNTTQRTQRQHQRPPGLKGRAIGLFYRDRQKANRQFKRDTKKEIVISFNLPPAVKSQVYASLKYIYEKAAKKQNIEIIEVNLPEFAKEFPVGGISRCHGRPQPIPSLATSNHHVITQPTASTSNINSSDAVYYADITFEDDDIYIYDEKDSTFKIPEPITQTKYIPDKDSPLKKPEPKSETKYLEPQEPQPGTSSSQDEDFIALKNENPDDYVHEERIASLRGGAGDYKYSYKDIITETFDEKLSKSFAKGVNIALGTDMVIELSGVLYDEYQDMLTKHNYKKMMEFRRTLPTYKKRDDLLDVIRNNQVIVISGETGCGKSTQVPQLILDEAIANKRGGNVSILVTQPRRIAASSLAQRVAEERAERMGNSVGYAVRLEKVEARPRGSVMFCTTGILLAELEVNQCLTNYSHIILDEVHERDCHIDISMCMLKKVLNIRKDLKLILMSATIDAEKLSEYFNNCPMMHIEGLAYPVTDVYLEDILYMTGYRLPEVNPQTRGKWNRARGHEEERAIKHRSEVGPWLESIKRNIHREVYHTLLDYRSEDMNMELMCNLLIYIGRQPPGAVLVFLPGIGEITKLMREMKESGMFPTASYEIYPLHSKLPSLEQRKIFERPKMGVRKIIIATNIAETSITIDDIVYVVDCGKIKISGLNVEENVVTLQVEWVSQANLRQRRGRAGRCQPGICYHMLTSFRASKIRERLLPELQRSNLLEPVLTVKRLRLGIAAKAFEEMPSPPDFSTVQWAVKHLHQCGALDASETLTPLGWHLARLPVHPAAGKLLLLGALFGCLDRAASVAAVWGFKDPFQLVIGKEDEVDNMKRRFALGEPSDHVAISEALIQWERCPAHNQRSFAYNHYLSNNTLELLSDMKRQLGESLRNMGFMPTPYVKAAWENRNMSNISLFKAVVAAALYPNTASVRWTKPHPRKNKMPRIKVNTTEDVKRVNVHPSSVMSAPNFSKPGQPPVQLCHTPGANWLVYWLKQRSTDLYLIEVTLVYTLPLLFFGELKVSVDENAREDECLMCISTVKVRCQRDTATLLFRLRSLLDQVLATKVTSSIKNSSEHTEFEKSVLNAVTQLITAEDEQVTYVECDDDDSPSDHSEN